MNLDFLTTMKKELSVFLLCIVVSTFMIVTSYSVLQSSIENKESQNTALKNVKKRYYTAIERRQLLAKFESRFSALHKAGIAATEDRLHWVDVITNITNAEKIPYLRYQIDTQTKLKSRTLSSRYPDIDIFKSTMTLNMQLLHEGDLYTIINTLDKKAKGLFDVQSCKITKNLSSISALLEKDSDKNFATVCVLNWYTMQKKSKSLPTRKKSNV